MLPPSRPSRARGLKHLYGLGDVRTLEVAPFAGAWIETCPAPTAPRTTLSRPSRARGLKRTRRPSVAGGMQGRALRGRVD